MGRLLRAAGVFRFNFRLEFFRADFVNQNLDARLVLVVPAAIEVINPHDGLEISHQFFLRQEVTNRDRDHRRAALATANHHFPANRSRIILVQA